MTRDAQRLKRGGSSRAGFRLWGVGHAWRSAIASAGLLERPAAIKITRSRGMIMIRKSRLALAVLFGLALASCTSAQPKNEMNIAVGPNGEMIIVTKDGKPSTDPNDKVVEAMINQAAQEEANKEQAQTAPVPTTRIDPRIWREDADHTLVHLPSGAICPTAWASLMRGTVQTYRPDGSDVGCNYSRPGSLSVVTFYVFHGDLDAELASALDAMKARQPTAKPGEFSMASQAFEARTLLYSNADGRKMRTSVLFAKRNGWLLEIRVTCPEADIQTIERPAAIGLMGEADRLATPTTPQPPPQKT
jgi:hypothetical protein